ncbi:MAG: signal recognition particle-docking protein FtsY [Ahrensia sp.]
MAGFLKRIFSFGKKPAEDDAPKSNSDGQPLVDDTPINVTDAPDPDAHAEAAAHVIADAEAGAQADEHTGAEPIPGMPDFPEPDEVNVEKLNDDSSDARAVMDDAEAHGFNGDGVFQPTPETAPDGIAVHDTPDPLSDTPEPSLSEREPEELYDVGEPTEELSLPDALEMPSVAEPEPAQPVKSRDGKVVIGDDTAPQLASAQETAAPKGWLARLSSGLSRSSKQLTENIAGVFTKRKLDDDTLEELEDILLQADLGMETAMRVTDALSEGRFGKDISVDDVRAVMASEIEKVLTPVAMPLELDLSHKPHVILVVGVNGTGKTTTIGKLTAKLRAAGLSVTLGAGDTFRAAAIEQLKIWADRSGATFVGTKLGADAAGLAYSAFETAKQNGSDVVIIDTAGRLQNKTELMDELAKIVRVLQKHDPDAPHTVLQTLDATTGQNALNQVEIFRNVAGVNGLVMTKLDGTARGGILVAISAKFKLPVYFIGVGEGVDDLEPFRAKDFAHAIAGSGTIEATS